MYNKSSSSKNNGSKSSSSKSSSSQSSSSKSSSSQSIKTKYVKEMTLPFLANPELKNKLIDTTDIILKKYYELIEYNLVNELQKIIPFESQTFTNNAVNLALNPNIYQFIPNLLNRISHDPEKLLMFYHNLANNKSKKVIPYLKTIYDNNDPTTEHFLNWEGLSANKNAIEILTAEYEKTPNKLVWSALCKNPNAIKILQKEYKKTPNKLEWSALCENQKAIKILQKEYDNNPKSNNIDWNVLCENQKAIKILLAEYEKTPNKLVWSALCKNPKAIEILQKEYDNHPKSGKLNWDALCENPEAIKILEAVYKANTKSKKLNWDILSGNIKAIPLLTKKKEELDKSYDKYTMFMPSSDERNNINWDKLSANPSAINFLENNYNKINWNILSGNTNIYAIRLLDRKKYDIVDGRDKSNNINWDLLSGNPNAINLIIDRIRMEQMNEHIAGWHPKGPEGPEREINWKRLSANPAIFTINEGPIQISEKERIYEREMIKAKKDQEEYSNAFSKAEHEKTQKILKALGREY
jgi:hypothetical protein